MAPNISWHTHHLLSDGVVCCLKIAEHLGYDLLGIAAITHGIQQIRCPLSNTHIPLSLQRHRKTNSSKVQNYVRIVMCC